jgi:hypothetical protein
MIECVVHLTQLDKKNGNVLIIESNLNTAPSIM